MHDQTTISNGTPSLTSPTARPNGYILIGGTTIPAYVTLSIGGRTFEPWELDHLRRSFEDHEPIVLRSPPARTKWVRLRLHPESARSNGSVKGLPSYTEQRFAPPRRMREPESAPRAIVVASRGRSARGALKRRKRSRDYARTGRRSRPCRTR